MTLPNLGQLLFPLPQETKNLIRRYERLSFKIVRKKCSLIYNQLCIREGLLPAYTNIKLHDEAAKDEPFTLEFRQCLLEREIENANNTIKDVEIEALEIQDALQKDVNPEHLSNIFKVISNNSDKLDANCKQTMVRKLSQLSKCAITLPEHADRFVNLSDYELNDTEKTLLNLGLNCHVQTPVDSYKKKVELEVLYDNILGLQKAEVADINPNIRDQLRAEGTRIRGSSQSNVLTPELKEAAKNLRENKDIVIRRADKSNVFVILNRDDYREKLSAVLSDGSKFQKVKKNPCEPLKKKINSLIETAVTENPDASKVLKKVVGDYSPGYMYGNVKTHKESKTIRPIVSQITTPTYTTAKQLDNIIKKYLPQGYMLKSSSEFIDLLEDKPTEGNLYSLDVESLFTNVPVLRTVNIICDRVYSHPTLAPPPISREVLKKLLLLCTTDVPFYDIDGNMWIQIDGVTMGSPLGPTFANFFMSEVEHRALDNIDNKPNIYVRYIDDIFLLCYEDTLNTLKNEMILISGLNFTFEVGVDNKIPFLNVLVEKQEDRYKTTVYRKPTDVGACMNANGDAPVQYKSSVIKGFLYRAKKLCSDHSDMILEIKRAKQILINNGYSNLEVEKEIKTFLGSLSKPPLGPGKGTIHTLYYQNFMNTKHREDERVLKKILKDNVILKDKDDKLKLVVFYKNMKTRNLVMRNNMTKKPRELAKTNAIYQFQCKKDDCEHLPPRSGAYTGLTKCTVSRRLSIHLQTGAIRQHCEQIHGVRITRKEIERFTRVRYQQRDSIRLEILEALIINAEDPEINRQDTGKVRTLKLYGNVNRGSNLDVQRTASTSAAV